MSFHLGREIQDLVFQEWLSKQGIRAEQTRQFGGGRRTPPGRQRDVIGAVQMKWWESSANLCCQSLRGADDQIVFARRKPLHPFPVDLHRILNGKRDDGLVP